MQDRDFERLYEEHAPRIYAFFAYRVPDASTAEDLTAETFERAFRARRRYDPERATQSTWLYAIALNRLRDHGRRRTSEGRANQRVAAEPAPAEADAADGVSDRDEVHRALRTLSTDEQETIALRFGADLTAPQIAAATGESLTTVEGRLYRALRKLRERLESES